MSDETPKFSPAEERIPRKRGFRWPWVSRRAFEMLQFAYASKEADVYFERNRWMGMVNAERARADRLESLLLSTRSPSGLNVAFPGMAGGQTPRPPSPTGKLSADAFARRAQVKADREYEEAKKAGDLMDDPVPGMSAPEPDEEAVAAG